MIIDSHAHFVPPSLLAEIADTAADFPALELVKYDNGFGFPLLAANQHGQSTHHYQTSPGG